MTKDLEALIEKCRAAIADELNEFGPRSGIRWYPVQDFSDDFNMPVAEYLVAACPSVVEDIATRLMKAEAENIRLALELKKAFNKEEDYVNQIENS